MADWSPQAHTVTGDLEEVRSREKKLVFRCFTFSRACYRFSFPVGGVCCTEITDRHGNPPHSRYSWIPNVIRVAETVLLHLSLTASEHGLRPRIK
jgi:hypothetical protein